MQINRHIGLLFLIAVLALGGCITTGEKKEDTAATVQSVEEKQEPAASVQPVEEKQEDVKKESPVFVQLGHSAQVNSVAFSPDGKLALSGSHDNTLRLWDVATGRELRTFTGHSGDVSSVAFSPDGKLALSGSDDQTLRLWEVETGKEIRIFTGHSYSVNSVAFSPDGRFALSGSDDKTLRLWDVTTGNSLRTFTGHYGNVNSVAFSPDGKLALSGSGSYRDNKDNTFRLWEVETGKEIRTFPGHSESVNSVAFSPDGKLAFSGSDDDTLQLWEVTTGKELRSFTGDYYNVKSVAFSPDGRFALSGGWSGGLRLWDIETGKEIRTFTEGSSYVESVAFSPDGKLALSGSHDNTLRLWEVETGKAIRTFTGHSSSVNSVSFSLDGKLALSGGDETIRVWDMETGKQLYTYCSQVESVSFSPDGKLALLRSYRNTDRLWDVEAGKEIRTVTIRTFDAYSFSLSNPDGRFVFSRNADKHTFRLWEVATGKQLRSFIGHSDSVNSVVFSSDSKLALSGSDDKTLRLWEVATGKQLRSFIGHSDSVNSVILNSDDRLALSGSDDKTLRLWEVATGKEIRTFTGHSDNVNYMGFSPDDRFVFSVDYENIVRLWDLKTGKEIPFFGRDFPNVKSVTFCFDRKLAFLGNDDDSIRVLDLKINKEIFIVTGYSSDGKLMSPDGKLALDKTMRLWNVSLSKELCQFVAFEDGEWVAITPEGYYNASANAEKYINVRNGLTVTGADQYGSAYHRPDIVARAIALGDTEKAVAELKDVEPKREGISPLATETVNPLKSAPKVEPPKVVEKPTVSEIATDRTPPAIEILEPAVQETEQKDIVIKLGVSDDSGIYEVLVNGKETNLSAEGRFWINVPLILGKNEISISATDGKQNKADKSLSIVRKTDMIQPPAPEPVKPEEPFGNYHALLIAVQDYTSSSAHRLNYPISDAKKIQAVLTSDYTFDEKNIIFLENPDRKTILNTLYSLRKLTEKDNLFVFYAGHGYWDKKSEQGYWLPKDASKDDRSEWLSNGDIRDSLRGIKTKHTLLVSDACFSGGIFDEAREAFSDIPPSVQEIYGKSSRRAITSGMKETVPDHSVFLEYLIRRLTENQKKYLDAQELYVEIRDPVINNSPLKQKPLYGVIHQTGDEGGDFIFIRRK